MLLWSRLVRFFTRSLSDRVCRILRTSDFTVTQSTESQRGDLRRVGWSEWWGHVNEGCWPWLHSIPVSLLQSDVTLADNIYVASVGTIPLRNLIQVLMKALLEQLKQQQPQILHLMHVVIFMHQAPTEIFINSIRMDMSPYSPQE